MRINLASLFPWIRSRMALKPPVAEVPAQICAAEAIARLKEARSSSRESARSELPAGVERRFLGTTVELRAAKDGKGPGTLVGYAATFDQSSVDLGGFVESIAQGAFSSVLEDDCRCLRNHCDESLLGRTTAGTLRLSQDSVGLRYECDLPDTTAGRDTAELVRLKNITGCSFQFTIAEGGQSWEFAGNYSEGMAKRTITKIGRLYDVGPVTFPAYESTKVDMRSVDAAKALRPPSPEQLRTTLSRLKARQRFAEASVPPG